MTKEEFSSLKIGDIVHIPEDIRYQDYMIPRMRKYFNQSFKVEIIVGDFVKGPELWSWRYQDVELECLTTKTPSIEPSVAKTPELTYLVIATDYPSELSKAVSERLAEGWQLYGSPYAERGRHCQALHKPQPLYKELA